MINIFQCFFHLKGCKNIPLAWAVQWAVNRNSASTPKSNPKRAPKGPEDFATPVCVFPFMSHDASAPLGEFWSHCLHLFLVSRFGWWTERSGTSAHFSDLMNQWLAISFPLTTHSCSYSLSLKCAHGYHMDTFIYLGCLSCVSQQGASYRCGSHTRGEFEVVRRSLQYWLSHWTFSFHFMFTGWRKRKKNKVPLSEMAHCHLLFDRKIFFVSWTKMEFPSLVHLAQIETTLKAISLYFPEEWLHRDDICLVFTVCLMWNFIKINCLDFFIPRSET